jgi:hypothetical protein
MLLPCQAIAKKILLSKAKNLLQEPPIGKEKLQFKNMASKYARKLYFKVLMR